MPYLPLFLHNYTSLFTCNHDFYICPLNKPYLPYFLTYLTIFILLYRVVIFILVYPCMPYLLLLGT